ncbi:intradiol ring-cleavage dioxygenase [Aspergillus undulatus]|uniref:intradiol ring-cleavage dioxygenase n=1 Tax=Aspergillus undulatus TaxID=1810928 RepID=UPI003CCCA1AF
MFAPAYLLALFVLAIPASAHPGPHGATDMVAFQKRAEAAGKCTEQIGLMKRKNHALRRRDISIDTNDDIATYLIHANAPKYEFIKNESCILTPETSNGPYVYPRSQVLRQDIREGQPGVPLSLEIGVVDIHTCLPLPDVLVDIWHCNATGSYSSFTGLSPNTHANILLEEAGANITDPSNGLGEFSWLSTDNSTFLRGMWPTNNHGVTSFTSIFPGFYVDRSIHIHVQVHTDWSVTSNGTLSHGPIVSTGQIFADEALERQLMALEPYASHTQIPRTLNDNDGIYTTESMTGAMTLLDTEPLDGVDYRNGVLGYITLVVDTTSIKDGSTVNPDPSVKNLTALASN